MRKIVLILPELTGEPGESSVLRDLTWLRRLAEMGRVSPIHPLNPRRPSETIWLGLAEGEGDMAPGPLTVAGLGADPPDRSTHFVLSLLSFTDGAIRSEPPSPAELAQIKQLLPKLDTKVLTTVFGESTEHGLVWEGRGDLHTWTPDEFVGERETLRGALPEGDGDERLRRLIDDSQNLLMEQEFNRKRIDEGRPALNLLWPWGQGQRLRVPNLAIRRGDPAWVQSRNLRLQGLSRLAGYRHGDRAGFAPGTRTPWRDLLEATRTEAASITVVDAFCEFRRDHMEEERIWLAERFDALWIQNLLESFHKNPTSVLLASPSRHRKGLLLQVDGQLDDRGKWPFDERTLEESRLQTHDLSSRIAAFLSPD